MPKPLLIIPAALLVAGIGAAAILVRPSAAVPERTYVAGVAVGGLSGAGLTEVLDGTVRSLVERPVTLELGSNEPGSNSIRVEPAELGISLDTDATRAELGRSWRRRPAPKRRDLIPVLTVDPAAAGVALDARLKAFRQPARNRSVHLPAPGVVLDGKADLSYTASRRGVEVDPGEPGRTVDTAAAVRLIADAVRAGRTTVPLTVTTVAPGDDTPKLAGVDQLIGTFTTYHPCCAARITNIHRIAELIDGTIVAPGGTFSLNDTAGERTAAHGFVPAPAIVAGEIEDQLGGGVSQFSTTLFNATWFAGLDIRRHQPHSLYIGRYPPGREATLDWGSIDQVFRNDTGTPIVIRTRTTGTSVTVGIYGHTGERVVDSVTGPRQPTTGGGFSVAVRRTIHQDGQVSGGETLHWTYKGLD
jgi:hypothetical protein